MNNTGQVERELGQQGQFQRTVIHAFGLRPAWREVFLLCDVQGFTIAEAAIILGLGPAVVTTRLDQARHQMNARLQGQP